jgi:kynureninase
VRKISKACRSANINFIVDFAHGIGALDLEINSLDVTAGVFCTYKYLSAGPGSLGGIYIRDR